MVNHPLSSAPSHSSDSLHVETVSTLMFLALNGPPLEKFDPLPQVRSWLEKGHGKSTARVSGPQGASNLDKRYDLIGRFLSQ